MCSSIPNVGHMVDQDWEMAHCLQHYFALEYKLPLIVTGKPKFLSFLTRLPGVLWKRESDAALGTLKVVSHFFGLQSQGINRAQTRKSPRATLHV